MRVGLPIVRTRQPQSLVPVDRNNRFGARARFLYYAHNGQGWDAVAGRLFPDQTGNALYGIGRGGMQSISNSANANLYYESGITLTSRAPDVLCTAPQTIIVLQQGAAASWQSAPACALYDASSGSMTGLQTAYAGATAVQVGCYVYGGAPSMPTVTVNDSLAPHVYACVYLGSNTFRVFVDGIFAQQQTQTSDAAQSGSDTQIRFGRSNAGVVLNMTLVGWFAGAFTDTEVFELSQNVWQLFTPQRAMPFPASSINLASVLPSATQSAGSWTPTGAATIHQCLNDASDSTYAAAAAPAVFVVQLAAVTNPGSTSSHKIKFRGSSSSSSQYKMSLYDGIPGTGGTLIEEWTETLTGSVVEYTHDCSPTNIANINAASYYGSLYLRGEAL